MAQIFIVPATLLRVNRDDRLSMSIDQELAQSIARRRAPGL
ncbi:MAG TPA: hypothetical protein VE268_03420 [Herpetosiphonaceae bacterium]|nr:hypothetical protein [Herpetosiphonaceae bacterium]